MKRVLILFILGLFLIIFMVITITATEDIILFSNETSYSMSDGQFWITHNSFQSTTRQNISEFDKQNLTGSIEFDCAQWDKDLLLYEALVSINIKINNSYYYGTGGGNCYVINNTWIGSGNTGKIIIITGYIMINSPPGMDNQIISHFRSLTRIYENGSIKYGSVRIGGYANFNENKRISTLESWKQSLVDLLNSILNRLTKLESQSPVGLNGTIPNFFKYLSSSDRKNMVCGYAQDNHLTNISDLGFNCTISYKTSRNNVTTSSCSCKGK